jgi:hypothetical protein
VHVTGFAAARDELLLKKEAAGKARPISEESSILTMPIGPVPPIPHPISAPSVALNSYRVTAHIGAAIARTISACSA